ncbi:MAG: GMC family oxidoreductase [bacterium]
MKAEFVIVGSGAGGATLAKELTEQGRKVVILEKGARAKKLGRTRSAIKLYDKLGLFSKSKEGIVIYRTIAVGGTTIVSCGNMVRSLQKEFLDLGIDLEESFIEAEKEIGITSVPEKFILRGSKVIAGMADDIGYIMTPMPKGVDFSKCNSCGNCVLGCNYGAKWTAEDYINQAVSRGAILRTRTSVDEILISNGKAIGVQAGHEKIMTDSVVLCAGALTTPVILQKSGIKAGQKLFCDLFSVAYMIVDNFDQLKGITMAVVRHEKGFILSPFMDPWLSLLASSNLKKLSRKKTLGIMIKIADEMAGRVNIDGSFEKRVTEQDRIKLDQGIAMAKEILLQAGGDADSFFTTPPRGAHPGGTAAIGDVVDRSLETKIKNLFVCDASVLPTAPGLPPILTIVALAKWLAKRL